MSRRRFIRNSAPSLFRRLTTTLALILALLGSTACRRSADIATEGASARVDFNRDIRPIFNKNCTACHGGVKAANGVSFVYRETALGVGESGRPTIVPGRPEESELIARVTSADLEYRMPEPEHGPPLGESQIALLRQWITEGAEWSEHWAFVPPKPQPVPSARNTGWARGPIDRFILARLEQEKLTPSPEADRAALLRRVSLDLTGLPPTSEELASFLADASADAYEKQVDRLLASPRYGERWASLWLDLARYADTAGYESDRERPMWRYRDWLIEVLNRNLPYDRFVMDQIAGDLVPGATLEQIIATAFNRQTQTNNEGGTDDEEFRVAAVIDRVATTWSAFNGVTFNCVQCHSHPYDPIRHEEFYRFAAFFNTTCDADYIHEFPHIYVPDDPARRAEALGIQREIDGLRRAIIGRGRSLAAKSGAWTLLPIVAASSEPAATFELRDGEAYAIGTVSRGSRYAFDAEIVAPRVITALRIEVPPLDPGKARHTPEEGFSMEKVDLAIVQADGTRQPVVVRRFFPDSANQPFPFPISEPIVAAGPPKPKKAGDDPAEPAEPKTLITPFARLDMFDASPKLDRTRWHVAVLENPLTVDAGGRLAIGMKHGRPGTAGQPHIARRVRLFVSDDARWTALAADPAIDEQLDRIVALADSLESIPGGSIPVMREQDPTERREMRLFVRGNFLEKEGPPLAPDVPEVFPPLDVGGGATPDRLALARWFVAPGQPLTSRVAVSRYWEQLWGVGLVETLEDFGSSGEPPSHPQLLDWLALRFENDLHWDVKALLREMVSSAAYRQSARVSPQLLERDPRNRLLARGPRQQLTAEMVRDQALFSSGLLSDKMYGPPVMPPQPDGLWKSVYNEERWNESVGEDRHRRAVYTYWKRSNPYPSFMTFDLPSRVTCAQRRFPTNTPLHALVALNDPVYHEAALALGSRMQMAAQGAGLDAALALGGQSAISHDLAPAELAALHRLYDAALSEYRANPALTLEAGASSPEHAALTAVASAILNLDAALTR